MKISTLFPPSLSLMGLALALCVVPALAEGPSSQKPPGKPPGHGKPPGQCKPPEPGKSHKCTRVDYEDDDDHHGNGHGKPCDDHGKPGDDHGKPGDNHGKPGDNNGKPGDNSGKPNDDRDKRDNSDCDRDETRNELERIEREACEQNSRKEKERADSGKTNEANKVVARRTR